MVLLADLVYCHLENILKRIICLIDQRKDDYFVFLVVVVYPTPSERWGHGESPWSLRSRATPQGLDQRSYRDRELPKSERHKESIAGQCRMR